MVYHGTRPTTRVEAVSILDAIRHAVGPSSPIPTRSGRVLHQISASAPWRVVGAIIRLSIECKPAALRCCLSRRLAPSKDVELPDQIGPHTTGPP